MRYTCGRVLAVGLGGDMLAVSSASGEMTTLLKWGGVFLRGVIVVTRGNSSYVVYALKKKVS